MKSSISFFFGLLCFLSYSQSDLDLAESYFGNGEFKKALYLFKKLQAAQPNNSKYSFRVIQIYQELEKFESSQSLINSQLKKSRNPQYIIELGYNYQLQNKLDSATVYYNKAIDIAREKPTLSYTIALKFEEHSLVDQAIQVYELAILKTKNSNYNYRLAGLYAIKQDVENMFLNYLIFTEKSNAYNNQILQLFNDYITEDPNSKYNQILKKIILKKLQYSSNTFWNETLSWIYIQEKEYKKALTQQKSIFRRNQKSLQGIIDIGFLAMESKQYEISVTAFDFIIEKVQEPKIILEAKLQILKLDLLRFASPDFNFINSQFLTLIKRYGIKDSTIDLQLSYVDFLLDSLNKYSAASNFLTENLKVKMSKINLAKIKIKLADILLRQEQFNRALVFYTQAQSQIKNSSLAQEARFKAAKTSYFKGDFEWAEAQLKVLKSSTSQLIANDALELQLMITDHKLGDSLQSALRIYSKADMLQLQKRPSEAIDLLDTLITTYPNNPIVDQALLLQGRLMEKNGNYLGAIEKYQNLINDFSTEILADDAYFDLAELYRTVLNMPQKAKDCYEKIIFDYQDSIHVVESTKHYRNLKSKLKNTSEIRL